jgi:hypothetical protein
MRAEKALCKGSCDREQHSFPCTTVYTVNMCREGGQARQESFFSFICLFPFYKLKTLIRDIHIAFIHHLVAPIILLRIEKSGNISGLDTDSIPSRDYQLHFFYNRDAISLREYSQGRVKQPSWQAGRLE